MTPPAPAEAPGTPAAPVPVDRREDTGQAAEPANQFLLSPEQRFGHAPEQNAPTEFERTAQAEPEQAAGEPAEDRVVGAYPSATADERGGFYDLVIAARNKAIDVEPEPPPRPKLRITSPVFLAMLVVLFLFGLIMLEHRAIVSLIPASAGLFKLLGM